MPDNFKYYYPEVSEPNEVTAALVFHAEASLQDILGRIGRMPAANHTSEARLHLSDSLWAYQDYLSRTLKIRAHGSSGIFYANDEVGTGIAMYIRGLPVLDLKTTIQHECFHHAAYLVFEDRLPRWLNEGLAQYFQDAILIRGRLRTGMVNPDRLEKLKRLGTQRATAAELIETPDQAWFVTPTQSTHWVSRLYESAWAVVLTLIAGPRQNLCDAFAKYLGLLSQPNVEHERAWELAMRGVNNNEIDDAVDHVLQTLEPPCVSTAIHKMALLADILGQLNELNQRMPTSLDEARNRMRMLGVEVYRRIPGSDPIRRRGDDESLYFYPLENGLETEFELTPPENRQHPPTLSAVGVMGNPYVRWIGRGRRCVACVEFDS